MFTILKLGSSGYVFGVLAWLLGILIGQSAAAWPIKCQATIPSDAASGWS